MKAKLLTTLGLSALAAGSAFAATPVPAGAIIANTSWTAAASPYILEGLVTVESGAILDIEPGTIIRGQPVAGGSVPGTLLITRTGKVQIRGTSSAPVIFTTAVLDSGLAIGAAATGLPYDGPDVGSEPDLWTLADGDTKYLDLTPATAPLPPVNPLGERNSKFWGGLIICGNAPTSSYIDTNIPVDGTPNLGEGFVEGLLATASGRYGGTDAFDDSGIVRYVSIRHAGFSLAPASEVNGLTLYGVGRGTTIDHVEVYCNVDDGVEVFGGTVDLSYLSIAFAEDDGFDTDQGHTGSVQFLYVLHGMTIDVDGAGPIAPTVTLSSSDPRGMELDGDDSAANVTPTGTPREATRIYNATVQSFATQGAFMRNGFGGAFVNNILHNCAATALVGLTVSTGGFAGNDPQTQYSVRDLDVRHNTFNGWTTSSNTFLGFTPHTNAGVFPSGSPYHLAQGNSTGSADMVIPTYVTDGIKPRVGDGPFSIGPGANSAQPSDRVLSSAVAVSYRGAFPTDGTTGPLWTTGWTAINKTNKAGIKLLGDL